MSTSHSTMNSVDVCRTIQPIEVITFGVNMRREIIVVCFLSFFIQMERSVTCYHEVQMFKVCITIFKGGMLL